MYNQSQLEALAAAVQDGDRRALARAITLIESGKAADRQPAATLLELLGQRRASSMRIGISGVPGVGKSTFIEALGTYIIERGHRVAVLAVDPTSAISGGSIMGDKTRMEKLSQQLDAFIRPSPAGGTLGGVTRHTQETIRIVEAAGFDVVIVETVGVGQSETAVAQMTDMFLLMLLPGGGDELQGIKRGIVELADLVVVNKADGDLKAAANRAAADYRNALGFVHPRHQNWTVPVVTCSALEGEGIDAIWDTVGAFRETMRHSGAFEANRAAQARTWLWNEVSQSLVEQFKDNPEVARQLGQLEEAVADQRISPWAAAQQLVSLFQHSRNSS